MKLLIEIPEKTYHKIIEGTYDYGDMNVIFQNGTPFSKALERPHGEWIDYSYDGFVECPFCGNATICDDNIDDLHYCFSCGAKLGGD